MPPRRSKAPAGPVPVDAIVHSDKRANLPTADAHDLVTPDVEAPLTVTYPRDVYSPMLVWQGKEEQDAQHLEADAPPIYIQEKVDPRVLIEHLRATAKQGDFEPELTLFEGFDGLGDLDLVEFYRHEANWSNRMILGDSLQVMASLDSRERIRGKVQMIYLDPPYGIKFGSNWQVSARKRDVKDGKYEDIAREAEQIKAFRDTWDLGIHSYLTYLRDRLLVARDLLTESGSIFVQISNENVHLVRSLLDEVFGAENFVATIVWKKAAPDTSTIRNAFNYLLWVAKDVQMLKVRKLYRARRLSDGSTEDPKKLALWGEFPDQPERPLTTEEKRGELGLPAGTRVFRMDKIVDQGVEARVFPLQVRGESLLPPKGFQWRGDQEEMQRLVIADRVRRTKDGVGFRLFLDDHDAVEISNFWEDTGGKIPDMVYVVQTNTKIVQRCLLMTTDPGDLVLDPTCGSGTTAYVAEQWGRRWITVDTSRVALALARQRLMGARFPYYLRRDSVEGRAKEAEIAATPPAPAEITGDIRQGFVYERVQHVTLKSIANNPDVQEGMSREGIDAAIQRHAEFEELVDKPYVDNRKVRVTGPFTVESLSPHRSLAFAPSGEPAAEREAAIDPEAPTFEQTILENLRVAGVQNGRRAERLAFDDVESYAGTYIQAVGVRAGADDAAPSRVGISIGPQYGTVSPRFVKDAAREASRATDLDLLCVLGFAFDPQVLESSGEFLATDASFDVAKETALGRVPVLLVRMNADLLMGEELKKTGAGNLFTVFGEPDIDVREIDGGELVVEVKGVDVYDPTTGAVRSGGVEQVALWMIDTDYDEESFFVRHCYFTGNQDPYKRLKQALKADIDEEAWASLYRTESRPFPKPTTGKLAVKVINDYGDEVVKVFEV